MAAWDATDFVRIPDSAFEFQCILETFPDDVTACRRTGISLYKHTTRTVRAAPPSGDTLTGSFTYNATKRRDPPVRPQLLMGRRNYYRPA
eukprot:gene6565-5830_t